ncbi:MAG: adenylyltransferase/cytidyltransferase family protein [Candidatus Staskawiczbacteria bacterium]|jgi:rfaE bifunctional protein nucleotidyltransferase chain/domain
MNKVFDKIVGLAGLEGLRKKYRGKKIGLCSGCFDIFHSGHAVFFQQCRELVDVLVVAVGSDSAIKKLKGPGRPVSSQNNRVYLVASIENVDYAILGSEAGNMKKGKIDFYDIAKNLRPDIFVLNNDDSNIAEKQKMCDNFGIKLILVERIVPDFLKGVSSTGIIKQIKEN